MKLIMRLTIIAVCFFAAIACFSFGVPVGGGLFIILGILFEAMMWGQVFKSKKRRQ